MVRIGKKVPNFLLPATGDQSISLQDFSGTYLVLYFYPKDSTPGCTTESEDFRDHYKLFLKAGANVLGVSRDSVKSHEKFKSRLNLPFELLSDPGEELCRQFDVIREKTLYGRKFMGVERSTFLLDGEGVLRQEWRKVKVKGHADEVLQAVQSLN